MNNLRKRLSSATMRHLLCAVAAAVFVFTTPAVAADDAGVALYKQKACVGCHGPDGSGNTPAGRAVKARDLRSAEVQAMTDDALAAVIRDGRGKMPSFKSSLSAQQVRQLVAHIRTLAKKDS